MSDDGPGRGAEAPRRGRFWTDEFGGPFRARRRRQDTRHRFGGRSPAALVPRAEQTIRRTAEALVLYDDSSGAGRGLLRKMDDVLDGDARDDEAMRETREAVQESAATTKGHRPDGAPQLEEETSAAYEEQPGGGHEKETPESQRLTQKPEGGAAVGPSGRRKKRPRSAVKGLDPSRNPVIWSQMAALVVDLVVIYGLLPSSLDRASAEQRVAGALTMLGSHAGFGAAARQGATPLAKQTDEG